MNSDDDVYKITREKMRVVVIVCTTINNASSSSYLLIVCSLSFTHSLTHMHTNRRGDE